MFPVLLWEGIEADHSFPVAIQKSAGFSSPLLFAPALELLLELLRLLAGLRIGDPGQDELGLALLLLGELIEDIDDSVIPAALLLGFGIHTGEAAPDPESAISNDELRSFQPTAFEITQD